MGHLCYYILCFIVTLSLLVRVHGYTLLYIVSYSAAEIPLITQVTECIEDPAQCHTEGLIEESQSSISGSARSIPEVVSNEATPNTHSTPAVATVQPSTEYVQIISPGTPLNRRLVVPTARPSSGTIMAEQLGAYDHLEKSSTSTDYYNIPKVTAVAKPLIKNENPSGPNGELLTASGDRLQTSHTHGNTSDCASQSDHMTVVSADFKRLSDCTDMSTSVILTTEGITSSE